MKKVIAISFAFLIILSTVGITFTTHNCGDFIHNKSLSLGFEDLSCGMEMQEDISERMTNDVVSNNCCQNEFREFKITDKFQPATHEIHLNLQFVIAFMDTFVHEIAVEKKQASKYLTYHPPLPDKDIPVLFQSFLI